MSEPEKPPFIYAFWVDLYNRKSVDVRSYSQFLSRETSLYYLQSRYYNPTTGRFLNADNADNIDYLGADKMLLSYNMFSYCSNKPVAGYATEKGPISTMPEVPGLLARSDGHIGIYIGDDYTIEAMGTRYGVVKQE